MSKTVDDFSVSDVMTPNPSCLEGTLTLSQAYEWLQGEGVRGAPVIDEQGKLIGVISNSDLLLTLAPVLDPEAEVDPETLTELKSTPLTQVMEGRRPVTCRAEDSLKQACGLMAKHKVRRLVVTRGDDIIGVLSAIDVLRAVGDPDSFPTSNG